MSEAKERVRRRLKASMLVGLNEPIPIRKGDVVALLSALDERDAALEKPATPTRRGKVTPSSGSGDYQRQNRRKDDQLLEEQGTY